MRSSSEYEAHPGRFIVANGINSGMRDLADRVFGGNSSGGN